MLCKCILQQCHRYFREYKFVISRAGSSTVNEIISLEFLNFDPYPYAADNHQYYNASVLKSLNCAEIIKDKDMNTHLLSSLINKIINNRKEESRLKKL